MSGRLESIPPKSKSWYLPPETQYHACVGAQLPRKKNRHEATVAPNCTYEHCSFMKDPLTGAKSKKR